MSSGSGGGSQIGEARFRRVVLLGFMASGKSAVGRALAARLGWQHVDLDAEIERRAGRPIAEIFSTEGEAAFRTLEAELTPDFLRRDGLVFSPGGGWITNPGLLEAIPPVTLTVWLKVSPDEVVRRLTGDAGAPVRPLLQGPDPGARAATLLAEREELYTRADVHVDTDGRGVEEIAAELESIIRGVARAPAQQKS